MSKQSIGRFPSVRTNASLLKRQSLKQGLLLNSKEQFLNYGSQNGISDKKITQNTINTQSQITKKIQNKIRMRKSSGSQKKLKDAFNNKDIDNLNNGSQSYPDPIQDLKQKIQSLWQNSQNIYDALSNSGSNQQRDLIKEQILQQSSFILCQLMKKQSQGQNLESIIVQKIKRKVQIKKCVKKCHQKEQNVKNMFNDRIQKLSMILKTR